MKKLWLRKLSCSHERPTDLNYIMKQYGKPILGETCYCRRCLKEVIVISVEELGQAYKDELDKMIQELSEVKE